MRAHGKGRGRRRSGVLLVATGLACLTSSALPLFPAGAEEELGSGLGSFSLAANAPVLQVRIASPENQCSVQPAAAAACEGVINQSVSTMRNGPIGYALSSVGWPGTLAGNLGTLLTVASPTPPPPELAAALNYPVRAENTISGKDDTVSNTTIPGTSMKATAVDSKVEAHTSIGVNQATPIGNLGSLVSWSRTALTGPKTAEAVAHSEVQNLVLGPLAIEAVVSDAKATTDGTKAVPSGRTRVLGATVAGVPVTIDERGVTVQGQGAPLAPLTEAVNTALSQAGMTVALSTPIGKPEGPKALYNTGALNIVWAPPPPPAGLPTVPGAPSSAPPVVSILVGGAQVMVDSSPGYDFGLDVDVPPFVPGTGTTVTPPGDTAVPPGLSGGGVAGPPATTDGTTGPPPTTAGPSTTPVAAASRAALPGGLSPWYGVLAALGAGLVMAGLRRLPDSVLAVPATSCPLGDTA